MSSLSSISPEQPGLPGGGRLELIRQAQLVAGTMALLGATLGFFVAPGFIALAALVGIGLIHAGATGMCGMARLLALMPWNRRE